MGEGAAEVNRDDPGYAPGAEPAGADDTSEIRAGIAQTRGEMSETIDAIQERLSPQAIKEQVKDQVREATIGKAEDMVRNTTDTINDARATIMETVRQNPIPAALVGIGLGWLLINRRSPAPRGYRGYSGQGYYRPVSYPGGYRDGSFYDQGRYVGEAPYRAQEGAGNVVNRAQETVGNIADRAQETVGNIADRAQETVGSIADQAQEAAGYVADQAQYQARRVEDRFQQTLDESPLALGALAVALGTAVGFSLPQTRRENELLGEARDTLVERAQEVAQDTVERVRQVAGDVMEQAQTTAQEQARERGLTPE